MSARYRVSRGWSVTSPGGRQWTGAPSQPAAFGLAQSLAGIDAMLAEINRPKFVVVPDPVPDRRAYGFHRVPARAAQ